MASVKSAWGIEVGADAIKALRLESDGKDVAVTEFAVIPHKKILTTPDLDQDEMIRLSLGQLISQKSLEGEHLVMSVPGHAAFARFAKLPPVEPKKVPDIVKFEAVQQIPFPIDEVEWDYQTFTSDDSPEVEVGIFAITRDRVQQRLGLYGELGISPEVLTLSPVALYNALAYDLGLEHHGKPVVFLDIGTQATDVVIADEGRCWIRTFPLGGTHFTEAIQSTFKLSYAKAEKLKKEASTSKYAKQIMQAMRPVFSDLLQDLQRSIGYYQSLHRENELTTMVGIGSTFKIPGLRKFIGQQLQINVVRLDEYKKIAVTGREAAAFAEHTVNMATAYGLALQGVGLGAIDANLMPVRALREHLWHAKTKWFAAAAAIIVVGAATTLVHPLLDRGRLAPTGASEVEAVLRRGEMLRSEFEEAQSQAVVGFRAENMRRLTDHRKIWPHIVNDAAAALASVDPQPVLLGPDVEEILRVKPAERRLVQLLSLSGEYVPPAEAGDPRRISVTMEVEFSNAARIAFLNDTVARWLREHAEPEGERALIPYRIIADTISANPSLLREVTVGEDGIESDRGSGGAREPTRDKRRPPGARAPKPPPRKPPGAMGGGGGGQPGFGSSGGNDRRRRGGEKRAPPGAMRGGGVGFGTGAPSGGAARPPGAGSRGGAEREGSGGAPAGGRSQERRHADLDAMAPMPARPGLHPKGTTFYRAPITFEVELIVPDRKTDESKQARASRPRAPRPEAAIDLESGHLGGEIVEGARA